MADKQINDLDHAASISGAERIELSTGESATVDEILALAGLPGIAVYTASHVAVLADEVVEMNVGTANDFTVPPNSDVAFPVGKALEVWAKGAGQTTVVAGVGVTILVSTELTLKVKGQNSGCSLRQVAANVWRLIGHMELA